jgi:hypothetical protein
MTAMEKDDLVGQFKRCGPSPAHPLTKDLKHPRPLLSQLRSQKYAAVPNALLVKALIYLYCFLADRANIAAVLNLQQLGEHASCGKGNLPNGYSYDFDEFMAAGSEYLELLPSQSSDFSRRTTPETSTFEWLPLPTPLLNDDALSLTT